MSNKHTNNYKKVLDAFTRDELHYISQVKRFFEWYEGDADFRTAVNAGRINPKQQERMKQIGIDFHTKEMALLWKNPEIITECTCQTHEDIPAEHVEMLKNYPLMELWFRFIRHKKTQFREACAQRFPVLNTRFDNWRNRHIASAQSELGAYNQFIDHPSLAIELCDGCSVQCWFCAFSSNKLQSTLDYNNNKDFFRGIAQVCTDIFGGQAAGMALLYYATEPYDNPHYIDYIKDYDDITGSPVCTSTAVGTDKKWIDDLLAYYRPRTLPWPRLSVLSTKMLHKIHDNHSPDELRDVSLHMQMKDSEREKVSGGRIFSQKDDMRQRDSTNYLQDAVPQGTIACVTGFYINLVRKDIKLVSPCYTSEKWPYGYRVFDEASFDTVEDFRNTVLEMIERNMPDTPPAHMTLRLRDDLICKPLENGFDLISPNQIHHFQNKSVFKALGELLMNTPVSYQDAGDILVDKYRQDPFAVQAVLKYLFTNGFLDEAGLNT
ncbi:MAG: radical SAM family RiPP maturation amino acid epimerase [Firmicutes bacterium]|nr:radical SAM family RiPP maturation amino acid epimerase [Bacillota bacterium]